MITLTNIEIKHQPLNIKTLTLNPKNIRAKTF